MAIQRSAARWRQWKKHLPQSPLATKAWETLVGNWRPPRGAFMHEAIVPSTTARWFNGAWAWDSWKEAYAVASVDPRLAANSVRAMFDYQIGEKDNLRPQDAGMVIDAIFYNRDAGRAGDEIGRAHV